VDRQQDMPLPFPERRRILVRGVKAGALGKLAPQILQHPLAVIGAETGLVPLNLFQRVFPKRLLVIELPRHPLRIPHLLRFLHGLAGLGSRMRHIHFGVSPFL
jgi:hypothetical protein